MLTLRQIEVIRAIVITGTVGGAARLLNVSSPGVSRVMKHAESTIGLRDRLRMDCVEAFGVIQAWDVDPSESWPDGQHCEENEAISV